MESQELPFIREMFNSIAPRYDLLNRLLSLRQDVHWRKKLVSQMVVPRCGRMLDVACGTGDVISEIRRQKGPETVVTGIDFSPKMLALAREKVLSKTCGSTFLLAGDALAMPFAKPLFHAVTIAFGIRNIQDRVKALKNFCEILLPGGMVLVLELSTPKKGRLYDAYMTYFRRMLPIIGRIFSKHAFAYNYLQESVIRFPEPEEFMEIMIHAGFTKVTCTRLTLGVANLFIGVKPP